MLKRGAGSVQVGGLVKRAEERHQRGGVNLWGWGQGGRGLRVDGGWRGGGKREAEERRHRGLRNGFGWKQLFQTFAAGGWGVVRGQE